MSQRVCYSALWKIFDKTDSYGQAICSICKTYVSFKSTTANLKSHLKRKHPAHYLAFNNNEDLPVEVDRLTTTEIEKKPTGPKPSLRRSPVWNYFIDDTNDDGKVKCKLCGVIYSLSEIKTLYTLKLHLKNKHNKEYQKIEGSSSSGNRERESDIPDDDSNSNSSIKFVSEILTYFEQRDDVSRCTLCKKVTDSSVEEMKNHLEEEHPAVLISILNHNEENTAADEETYTEVVYLEDEQKQPSIAHKRRKTSDHQKIESKTATDSRPDIDSFLNYLSVLLRDVPKDAMPKLQLDVISCVLNAQINTVQNAQSKACNCKDTIPSTDYHISVDLGKIVENMNVSST